MARSGCTLRSFRVTTYQAVGFCFVFLFASAAPAGPLEPRSYSIHDGGAPRAFEIALDEVEVVSTGRQHRAEKTTARATPEAIRQFADELRRRTGDEVELVLYEHGAPRNAYTRRVLTKQVLVRLAEGADAKALAGEAGATVAEAPDYAPGYVILEVRETGGALGAAEFLRGRPGVLSAEPLLARQQKKKLLPNDPLFGEQWHLRNTGQNGGLAGTDVNLTNVWDTFRGSGIYIAIVDDGLQTAHTDLVENVNTLIDWDFNGGDNNPNPDLNNDFHGTACAGVAAGRGQNGRGISGAAPEATLVGLRLIGGPATDADEAAAMAHSNSLIQIKSNSWGPDDDGKTLAGPGPLTLAALHSGVTAGRGGRGVIYAWACGNGADALDNANKDGYANSIYTVAIGALSDLGTKASYSEPGANVVVCAPSSSYSPDRQGITTTDLMGNNGYNYTGAPGELADRNYTKTFGGTSSATPLAAGVMALILEAAPNLGWRDMQEILMRSATKNHPADADWVTNSAGFRLNHKYGAGLINARAAVTLAQTWTHLGAQVSISQIQTNLSVAVPDNDPAGVTRTFVFSNQNLRIEHAVLSVDVTHFNRGDLEISLVSPSAVTSRLAELHNDNGDHYRSWPFMTVRHWGESPNGTWTVRLVDRRASYAGNLRYLRLDLYGTQPVVNAPPILNPIGSKAVAAGQTLSFPVSATDPNSDPITLTVSNRPDAATFSAAGGSGTFAWTNASPAGVYTTRFWAVDNQGGADSETVLITVSNPPPGPAPANVWINEFHYDNSSTDIDEGVEIAGPAGADLSGYSVIFYDGLNGGTYGSLALSGLIDNEQCGHGALWFAFNGIQNGAPDGLALVRNGTQVLQRISYEGSFTGSAGPAAGQLFSDIGVLEKGTEPAGRSLQLRGVGDTAAEFSWVGPTNASMGSLNAGQTISPCGAQPPILHPIGNKSVNQGGTLTFPVIASPTDGDPVTLTASNRPAGSTFPATTTNGTFAWTNASPAGVYTTRFFAVDKDGAASEAITITVAPPAPAAFTNAWINELHYDNTGADVNEGVEIAGVAGTALTNFSLVFYDGGAGTAYKTVALSGVIDNEACGYGAVWFAVAALQNGSPDGVALVRNGTEVVQFLSYEGSFAAVGGPAGGQTSVDIGVFQSGAEPVDRSLQLIGTGNAYARFAWGGPTNAASRGSLNSGQFITGCSPPAGPPPAARFAVTNFLVEEDWGTVSIPVALSSAAACTVRVAVAGNAGTGADFTLAATQLVFTGSATQQFIGVQIVNDSVAEVAKSIVLTLTNLSGATTGAARRAVIDLRDNDGFTVMAANLAIQTSACSSIYGDAPARIFRGLKPDIVAIQEFNVTNAGGHAAFVRENFGSNYYYWVENETDPCAIPNGIISRYPIILSGEWADGESGAGFRDFVWATIDLPGPRNLHVVSVHFTQSGGPAARQNEARKLTNYIAQANFPPDDYVVVAGDLNTTSRTDTVLQILTNVVVDTRPPADQNGDRDTNSGRNEIFDFVLPEPDLDALHQPLTLGGLTFTNGMVFDSELWVSPPEPILVTDSHTAGIQHMAVMKLFSFPPTGGEQLWMNELHYDNTLTDTGEGVEVAGTAGTALTNYSIVHYRATGTVISTTGLSGQVDDEGCGFGAVWFGFTLQNDRCAVALVRGGTSVVQFLSYEGAVTAIAGVASGMISTDLGVSEEPPSPVGQSLQLVGSGSSYLQFTWSGPATASPGSLNAGQSIAPCVPGTPPVLLPIGNPSVNVSNTLTFAVTALPTDGDAVTLTISNKPAGAIFTKSGGNGVFSWTNAAPAGVYTTRFWAVDNDGAVSATVVIRVLNPPPGGIGTLWINELHYDNIGTDINEGIEVAGKAGIVLTNYTLYSYEGSNGRVDYTNRLTGTVDFESCGFGAVWFGYPPGGLENDMSGFALVLRETQVVHFISYGGSFNASNGPAAGMTSLDIGLLQTNSPVGQSLQLTGAGTNFYQFAWTGPTAASTGTLNAGQSISPCAGGGAGPFGGRGEEDGPKPLVEGGGGDPPVLEAIGHKYVLLNDDLYFSVRAEDTEGDPITLSVENPPPGSEFTSQGGDGQFTWLTAGPAGVYTTRFYAADTDGENSEEIFIIVDTWIPPAGALVYYNFDQGGGFTNRAHQVAAHVTASPVVIGNDSLFGDPDGNPGHAARGSDWRTATANFMEFSMGIADGYAGVLLGVEFDEKRGAQGPTSWHLRYGADGFASDLVNGDTHSAYGDPNTPEFLSPILTGTNVFRLYATGAVLPGATWKVDNLLLRGVVLPVDYDAEPDGMPDLWEYAWFGDADAGDTTSDWDDDGFLDWEEYRAGTRPDDDTSLLRMEPLAGAGESHVVLRWLSVTNRTYTIERATNLLNGFDVLESGVEPTPPLNVYTDAPPIDPPAMLYRIRTQP
jgi:subtilisin-like proprotein convertase family protein/endonuclease/exonuclease/phosphatase family metal-dependent hydrolase